MKKSREQKRRTRRERFKQKGEDLALPTGQNEGIEEKGPKKILSSKSRFFGGGNSLFAFPVLEGKRKKGE